MWQGTAQRLLESGNRFWRMETITISVRLRRVEVQSDAQRCDAAVRLHVHAQHTLVLPPRRGRPSVLVTRVGARGAPPSFPHPVPIPVVFYAAVDAARLDASALRRTSWLFNTSGVDEARNMFYSYYSLPHACSAKISSLCAASSLCAVFGACCSIHDTHAWEGHQLEELPEDKERMAGVMIHQEAWRRLRGVGRECVARQNHWVEMSKIPLYVNAFMLEVFLLSHCQAQQSLFETRLSVWLLFGFGPGLSESFDPKLPLSPPLPMMRSLVQQTSTEE
ncbi:hypothetical protein DFH11DRAFT_1546329 [Phellopilus nigrolimitatus]|nr:hypothetical protein DFH11DRAFT_1546329 [Phellopilus nigrolimitatus]